jgi:hypothetical protein
VVSLELPIELSSSSGEGVTNKNTVRTVIANLANVRPSDVDILYSEHIETAQGVHSVISLAIIESTDDTKEHNLDVILASLENSLTANPSQFITALQSAGINTQSFGVVARPVKAMRVPTALAHYFEFADSDGRNGWVQGDAVIHKTVPTDRSCTRYLLYFGDGQGSAKANRVGDVVATVKIDPSSDTPFVTTHIPATQVPATAREWLVFAAGPYAEAANALNSPLSVLVREPPPVASSTISFHDQDERTSYIRGDVVIHDDIPISGATHYVLYFGNGGTSQLDKVGSSIGEALITFPSTTISITSPLQVPEGATHLLMFARNVDIESDKGITSALINLPANASQAH